MFAARRRAGRLVRMLQRTGRSYASDAHSSGPVHSHDQVSQNEYFGKGSIAFVTFFFGGSLIYCISPTKGEDTDSAISNFIGRYMSKGEDWEEINALHTKAMEQAGYDRNLFENASNKHRFVDVSYPEALQSYAPRNIPAGHIVNIDKAVEHYRQLHLKEEERKAKKLAAQHKD